MSDLIETPDEFVRGKNIEFAFVVAGLAVCSPFMAIGAAVALAEGIRRVRQDMKNHPSMRGSIFFRQERVGQWEKSFIPFKLSSMTNETDSYGNLLPSKLRRTDNGDFNRKWHIDELPQLRNVLRILFWRREMSFIGPRPVQPYELEAPLYTEEERKERQSVRPGITGWAQIHCPPNQELPPEVRKQYDLDYVRFRKNSNPLERWKFNTLILVRTLKKAVTGAGDHTSNTGRENAGTQWVTHPVGSAAHARSRLAESASPNIPG